MNEPQERMDLELRRLYTGLGRPALSADFGVLLQQRLDREKQWQRAVRRRLRLMQAYWLSICAASLYILSSWMQAGNLLSPPQVALVGAGVALLVLPLLLLLRGLRLSLMDLVFGTLDGFRFPLRKTS